MRTKRNAPCPCGSGNKYKRCCGRPRSILPSPNYITRPRRSPRRVALSGAARVTQTTLAKDRISDDEIIEAMRRADVRPAVIHAYKKTGLWLTEINRPMHAQEERDAWDAAIREYIQQNPEEIEDEITAGNRGPVAEDSQICQETDERVAG